MVRSYLRYYAWTLASWAASRLNPIPAKAEELFEVIEEDDEDPEHPASLTEDGWAMLYTAQEKTTTSEPSGPLAGSLAARIGRQEP